jgi:putative Mg2+ transporter-C (MgtC) family protein
VSGLGETALKIGLAALLAGLIGAEREWTGKWAGMRTHMLIAVGACLLAHLSHGGGIKGLDDGGRLAAQIVSGVGFIGAGTILQSRGAIHGLTTAAGLWVAAAIGIATGLGAYADATLTAVALFLILTALRPVERRLLHGHRRTVVLQLSPHQKLSQVTDLIETMGIETEAISVARSGRHQSATVCFRGNDEDARRMIEMASLSGIAAAEETAPAHRILGRPRKLSVDEQAGKASGEPPP